MDFSGKKKKDLKITPGFQAFLDNCGSNKVDNDLPTVEKWLFDQEVSPLSSPVRSLIRKNKVGNKVGKGYKPLFEYKQKPYLSSNSSINCDSYSIVSVVNSEKKRFKAMMAEDDDAEDALFVARIAATVLENNSEHNEWRKAGCPSCFSDITPESPPELKEHTQTWEEIRDSINVIFFLIDEPHLL